MADPDETPVAPDEGTATRSPLHARHEQTFPTLKPEEVDRLRRHGELRSYKQGEYLFRTGEPSPGMFIVLSGLVGITQRDGLGHVSPVVEQGEGQFLAEVGQLSGAPALVDGRAEEDTETLLIPGKSVRDVLITQAELGERILRALILRRVGLIQSGAGGPALVGPPTNGNLVSLEAFLSRNGLPHRVLDPEKDAEARILIDKYEPTEDELPLVVCPDGTVLKNPEEEALAEAMGMLDKPVDDKVYDVAVVGCGPAGMSVAVYAASEGLSVIAFDAHAFGGQAGASARIENYLGVPTGISGQALTARAFVQAQKFGAEARIPVEVEKLECANADGNFCLRIAGGDHARARAVVVASGACYRRPEIDRLKDFEGHGVWFWASPAEARLCQGAEVVLVGGGNSAGQAAVYLSANAKKVWMLVRGEGLADTMSKYLIDRIGAASNIEMLTRTEVVALEGTPQQGLQKVRWRHRDSGEETTRDIANMFLFVGADPSTAWLADCGVKLDKGGFVITGDGAPRKARRYSKELESSIPGVFAVGDVRAGSVKRVGSAIGEGAQVAAALHLYLAESSEPDDDCDPDLPLIKM